MIEIKFEESPKKTFTLYEEERIKRGKSLEGIAGTSYIDISEVISQEITTTDEDSNDEINHFLNNQDSIYRFNIIRVSCTFRATDNEHYSKAWISVPMHIGDSKEKPLVWSMTPENVTEDVKFSSTVKLSSELKFLKGEVSHGKTATQKDFFITSYREGTGAPLWEFKKTNGIAINGSYACYIIIRAKKSDHIKGEVQIKAVLKEKAYIIFNKEKDVADIPFLSFEIKPDATE